MINAHGLGSEAFPISASSQAPLGQPRSPFNIHQCDIFMVKPWNQGSKIVHFYVRPTSATVISVGEELKPKPERLFVESLIDKPEASDVSANLCEEIRKLCNEGKFKEALDVFRVMQRQAILVDSETYARLLQGCTAMKSAEEGKRVHRHMVEARIELDDTLGNKLVAMYAKCGRLLAARQVFDKMPKRNLVSWNLIIAGCAQHGRGDEAVRLFYLMREEGVDADEYTFSTVLRACAAQATIKTGKQVHACVVKMEFQRHVYVGSALVDMYAKCGSLEDARHVFDKMSDKNVVSWNAMIAGYAQHGWGLDALKLFSQMLLVGMKADHFTFATVIRVCAGLASLGHGRQVHAGIVRCGYELDVVLGTALVDLYSKWGKVEDARHVFDKMPQRNIISWNAMIAGYGNHGLGKEALQLFKQMQQEGMKPNHITFFAILSACSYSGLADEGWQYFNSMSREHGIRPRAMHYACMVEILGRTGHLDEAYNFINKMPLKPSASVWGVLLGACRMHVNLELGKFAAERLFELEPANVGNYVELLNIYAAAGRWEDAAKVKRMMENKGMKQELACTWIELKRQVHMFFVGDKAHPQTEDIYAILRKLTLQMKEAGYVPNADFVWHDREKREQPVSYHSEKLAIAFGLISTHSATALQIAQNHRICNDCHAETKCISKIVGRKIVVRDASRFHHFEDGFCSCGDYW